MADTRKVRFWRIAAVALVGLTACTDDEDSAPTTTSSTAIEDGLPFAPTTTEATTAATDAPTKKVTAAPSTATARVYYVNCSEARAAGAAPVHRGDPGYWPHLDRDGDGVACD